MIATNLVRFFPQQWIVQMWGLFIFITVGSISELGFLIAATTGLSLLSVGIFAGQLSKDRNKPFRLASAANSLVNLGRGIFLPLLPIIVWDYLGRLTELLRGQSGLTNSYDLLNDRVEISHKDELGAYHLITGNLFMAGGIILGGIVSSIFSFELGFIAVGALNLLAFTIRFNSEDFKA